MICCDRMISQEKTRKIWVDFFVAGVLWWKRKAEFNRCGSLRLKINLFVKNWNRPEEMKEGEYETHLMNRQMYFKKGIAWIGIHDVMCNYYYWYILFFYFNFLFFFSFYFFFIILNKYEWYQEILLKKVIATRI